MASLVRQVFRRKPVTEMTTETGVDTGKSELARSIGLFQLSMFGIGATIGTGIFFVLSKAVPVAGPAVIWSFVIAGVVAGLTAICYAELASAVPVSGSSYSYAYATLGKLPAVGVAACLLLEVRRLRRSGRGGLVAVRRRPAPDPLPRPDPAEPLAGAGAGRRAHPAGGHPGLPVRVPAHAGASESAKPDMLVPAEMRVAPPVQEVHGGGHGGGSAL